MSDFEEYYLNTFAELENARAENAALKEQVAQLESAFNLTQKDCHNLTEKVIPNIKRDYEKQLATLQSKSAALVELLERIANNDSIVDDANDYSLWPHTVASRALAAFKGEK